MRLGAAVSIVPMHNPLRIAEEFAMVDQLSGGRLNFGAGRGMHPTEYAVFGYEWNDAQKRLPEALDIIVRAWSGDEFEWKGEHYRISRSFEFIRSRVQQPHPPIYVTANRDPESFQMVGARGHHLMTLPWIATNEEQRPRVELYKTALREGGIRSTTKTSLPCIRFTSVTAMTRPRRKSSSTGIVGAALPWKQLVSRSERRLMNGSIGTWVTTRWCATAGACSAVRRPARAS